MKKRIFIGIFLVFSLVIISCNIHRKSIKVDNDNILGIYLDNELQSNIPKKGEAVFFKAVCDSDEVNYYWDIDNWGLYVNNFSNKMKCNLYFVNYSGETTFDFDYTGGEQTFAAPVSGTYRLETWGAQGGKSIVDGAYQDLGGVGGYSNGLINLEKGKAVYVNAGGKGADGKLEVNDSLGGYNGGGNGHWDKHDDEASGGGGGATHIAIKSGLLSTLENFKNDILIVSGGGGGVAWNYTSGNGGGYKATSGYRSETLYSQSATQLDGYKFGQGGDGSDSYGTPGGGGGGGYYGGFGGYIENKNDYSIDAIPGAGGSGYIGNPLLTNKVMYCYNCEESSEESTKTISTTCSEETPTSYCAKKGNGYARITLVSID
mgnify:CR=1 FL=1